MISPAEKFAVVAAASFFMAGLLSGVWKYLHMMRSEEGVAPIYVDITHRTSLMYSFACVLIAMLLPYSNLSANTELYAVLALVIYFALAVITYAIHGLLKDTDNQMKAPHKLGNKTLPALAIKGFMWSLVLGEIGGFTVLFYGVLRGLNLL